MRAIIGIDVSKNRGNAAVAIDLKVVHEFVFETDIIGMRTLQQTITNLGGDVEVVFEATGVYSRRLEYFLLTNHLRYHILNPLDSKNRIASGTRLRKSDARDARRLAITEFTEHLTPYLAAYKQSPIYRELMDMNRYYDQLNEDKKRVKNRVHRALQLTFASYEYGKNRFDFGSKIAWQLLTIFPHAGIVRQIGDLIAIEDRILEANIPGVGRVKAQKYARRLLKLAEQNADGVPVKSDNSRQVSEMARLVLQLDASQAQQIDRMVELGRSLPEFSILQSIPGFGESTAIRLNGELGDVRRFNTRQKLASFVGLDLQEVGSGDKIGQLKITKHGNPHARRILYWTVVLMTGSTAKDNHIRDHYQQRRQDRFSKKGLIVKEIDRLLKTILYLVKTNQTYQYDLARRN